MEDLARKIRIKILKDAFKAGACHIGSSLSCVEIVMAIDEVTKKNGGTCVFSKASGAGAVYALKKFDYRFLRENPLLYPGGSLGHGLPIACGMALAGKKIYIIMSDAELQEGTTWESLLFARNRKLSNLTIIVDYNKIQACGDCDDICSLEPLADKFNAFGCETRIVKDGNHYETVLRAVTYPPLSYSKPKVIICHTTKGKGVSFMENNYEWHYKNLDAELLKKALKEL